MRRFLTAPPVPPYWDSVERLPVEEACTGQLPPDQGAVYARVLSPSDTDSPSSSKAPECLKTRESRPFFAISIFKAKFPHCLRTEFEHLLRQSGLKSGTQRCLLSGLECV